MKNAIAFFVIVSVVTGGCSGGGGSASTSSSADSSASAAQSSSSSSSSSSSQAAASASSSSVVAASTSSSGGVDAGCEGACGVGCPNPLVYGCAADGEHYCSDCVARCHDTYLIPCFHDGGIAANPDAGSCGPPILPGDGVGLSLEPIHGPSDPLSPSSDGTAGAVASVSLERAGLSIDGGTALLQSVGTGLKLIPLDAIDADFGALPTSLANHTYDVRTASGFDSAALVVVPTEGGADSHDGQVDAVAFVNTGALDQPGQLFSIKLATDPIGNSPTAGPTTEASAHIPGYPSPNVALVDGHHLHVREDGTQSVMCFDLSSLPQGGHYATEPSRTFDSSVAVTDVFLNALTPHANSVTGDLAVTFTDATGAGVIVFDPSTLAFQTARLPAAPAGSALDLPAIAFSQSGDRIYIAWDVYDSGTFVKTEARLLAFNLVSGTVATLQDANPTTSEIDPALSIDLPTVHPTTIFTLRSASGSEEVGVVTAPYGGVARLDLYRLTGPCGATHLDGVTLGTYPATLPSVEHLETAAHEFLVVGTSSGIQVYELQR